MNILSLFDGLSGGRIALDRMGIARCVYFAAEIDKHAIKCSQANWDDVICIGDVTKVKYADGVLYTEKGWWTVKIDLLIGGSPCQSFSVAAAMQAEVSGLDGKSGLFYEYLRILREIKTYNDDLIWFLENVQMRETDKALLDGYLGVSGVYINSKDFSFQRRPRYYWTNLYIEPWEDRGVDFQDYKCSGDLSEYKVNRTPSRERMWSDGKGRGQGGACANVTHLNKIYCMMTKQDRCPNSGLVEYEDFCRYLTRRELELAQTVPEGYTACLSYAQACAVLGNGWTIDVIVHALNGLKKLFRFIEEPNNAL